MLFSQNVVVNLKKMVLMSYLFSFLGWLYLCALVWNAGKDLLEPHLFPLLASNHRRSILVNVMPVKLVDFLCGHCGTNLCLIVLKVRGRSKKELVSLSALVDSARG